MCEIIDIIVSPHTGIPEYTHRYVIYSFIHHFMLGTRWEYTLNETMHTHAFTPRGNLDSPLW